MRLHSTSSSASHQHCLDTNMLPCYVYYSVKVLACHANSNIVSLFWTAGPLLPAGPADDVEVRNPAKRQRLSIPEYGRSVSDPPLSFVRRSANAANMPVEALKLASLRRAPPPADLPKALRSIQSGPVRYGASSMQDPKLHMCREYCNKGTQSEVAGGESQTHSVSTVTLRC